MFSLKIPLSSQLRLAARQRGEQRHVRRRNPDSATLLRDPPTEQRSER